MNSINNFFRILYTNPYLLWRVVAGILFLLLAIVILLIPRITNGIDNNTKNIFTAFLFIYAIFRLATFYMEYKRIDKDE